MPLRATATRQKCSTPVLATLDQPPIRAGYQTPAVHAIDLRKSIDDRPILRGIDKFDLSLMLEGAIPAAFLALTVEGLFGLIERAVPGRS